MRFPSLYQINTRVVLRERGAATLDDLPDDLLDGIAGRGFTWVWLLGVWQTGPAGRALARLDRGLVRALPDLRDDDDITGSPFAITGYRVHRDFGGDAALARLRERLHRRGVKLLLDFVPNHVALDHPWVAEHPAYLVPGTEQDLAREPRNYVRLPTGIFAHGRDPNFEGWSDTVQLNHRHRGLRRAQIAALAAVADRCDGVRCDMAMLLEPAVIARTWGDRALPADGTPPCDTPFWPGAIGAVRARHPTFLFVAEVYWDLEWTLQQQGFDFTYDKRLYDRLRAEAARPVCDHLAAEPAFRDRCLRFLENHDEPRAAVAFPFPVHRAAAILTFFAPGLRFFHEGQLEGRRAFVPMQLARRPAEPADEPLEDFYRQLLAALARPEVHDGAWQLEPCREPLIVATWTLGERRLLTGVNYGPDPLRAPLDAPGPWTTLMGEGRHEPGGTLDLPAWGYVVLVSADSAADRSVNEPGSSR